MSATDATRAGEPAGALSAHEATSTHYCRQPGCTRESRSSRGPFAYCDEHRAARARQEPTPAGSGSTVAQLAELQAAAKRCDKLQAKADKLAGQAKAAKSAAAAAREDLAFRLRGIGSNVGNPRGAA